jgi:plastocyanin
MTGINAQTTHTVSVSGFTYSPADLVIATGDEVKFEGSSSHPLQEVSEETWTNNGTTPLSGGFAFEDGSGTVAFPNAGVYYYVCTSHVGQGMKGKITVLSPTAVRDAELREVMLYPVPLSGNVLAITLKNPVVELSLTVYDMAGKMWLSERSGINDGTYRLDCSQLPKGLYLLRMRTDETSTLLKFTRN